jgi:hypothetical protein
MLLVWWNPLIYRFARRYNPKWSDELEHMSYATGCRNMLNSKSLFPVIFHDIHRR